MNLRKYQSEIGFLILIILIGALFCFGKYCPLDFNLIQNKLKEFPAFYSGFLFVFLYVTITFFVWFAKDVFWLMAAVLFGAYGSTLLVCYAEVINAFILFYLSRYLGRGFLEKNLTGRYKKLDEKLGRINFIWLFILRAAPLVPYRFLDIAAGFTSMRFRKYLAAVAFGSPIKIFWIQYILYGVGRNIYDPTALMNYFLDHRPLLWLSLAYLVLVPLVIVKLVNKK